MKGNSDFKYICHVAFKCTWGEMLCRTLIFAYALSFPFLVISSVFSDLEFKTLSTKDREHLEYNEYFAKEISLEPYNGNDCALLYSPSFS